MLNGFHIWELNLKPEKKIQNFNLVRFLVFSSVLHTLSQSVHSIFRFDSVQFIWVLYFGLYGFIHKYGSVLVITKITTVGANFWTTHFFIRLFNLCMVSFFLSRTVYVD